MSSKDFPHLKKGDIVEIYHPEEEFSRLLLQVTTISKDTQGKTGISIRFQLVYLPKILPMKFKCQKNVLAFPKT